MFPTMSKLNFPVHKYRKQFSQHINVTKRIVFCACASLKSQPPPKFESRSGLWLVDTTRHGFRESKSDRAGRRGRRWS